jgi:hypothetical protein
MRKNILGPIIIAFAFTLPFWWMTALQATAGVLYLGMSIAQTSKKCPCCGMRFGHDEHCREMLHEPRVPTGIASSNLSGIAL